MDNDELRTIVGAEVVAVGRLFVETYESDPYLTPPYTSIEHGTEAFRRIALGLAERLCRRPRAIVLLDSSLFIDIVQRPDGPLTIVPLFVAPGSEVEAVKALHAEAARIGAVIATIGIIGRSDPLDRVRHVIVQVQSTAGLFRRAALNLAVRADRTVEIKPGDWMDKEPPPEVATVEYAKLATSPGSKLLN